jgi:hypothetical protein
MKRIFSRATGGLLILILSGTAEVLLAQQQAPAPPTPVENAPLPPVELPENPGSNTSTPGAPARPLSQNPPAAPEPGQPSGTAVAPPVEVSGGAASKPAGVAIAPPKQRQVRSWLIRFGFIAGAGAALGTVAALSAASPGHVPGSPH